MRICGGVAAQQLLMRRLIHLWHAEGGGLIRSIQGLFCGWEQAAMSFVSHMAIRAEEKR